MCFTNGLILQPRHFGNISIKITVLISDSILITEVTQLHT